MCFSCSGEEEAGLNPNPVMQDFDFRAGDLVFRCGSGVLSRSVLFLDKTSPYSHVGIVVRYGSQWSVVHAVPGEPDYEGDPDRVKLDPVPVFFDSVRAQVAAVYRYPDSTAAAHAAETALRQWRKGVLFDHRYDLHDSVRMYCTELVIYSYLSQGIDLVSGPLRTPNLPGFDQVAAFPSDLTRNVLLKRIYP